MRKFISGVEKLTDLIGMLAGLAVFVLGFLISYEVVARYVFNSPTYWVGEIALQIQIWVVFAASAYVLKRRDMVTIELVLNDRTTFLRKLSETFALVVLFVMTLPAIWFGIQIWLRSTLAGHRTDTLLGLPKWLTDAAVWVGFLFLSLQALIELWRIWTVGVPAPDDKPLDALR